MNVPEWFSGLEGSYMRQAQMSYDNTMRSIQSRQASQQQMPQMLYSPCQSPPKPKSFYEQLENEIDEWLKIKI